MRCRHPSHWGKICLISTTDGENCGLIKNLASLGLVSKTNLEPLLDKLFDCGMNDLEDDTSSLFHGEPKIFLDGDWVGTCRDIELFVAELRSMRRSTKVPQQVTCSV